MKKGVLPDGYFEIVDNNRLNKNQPARARFLLEIDMSTHSNPRFGREKAAPSVAYIMSKVYRERFGANSGRWLVVTTGDVRMKNLMNQTRKVIGQQAMIFFFTTFDQLKHGNILKSPIWWQVDKTDPQPLLNKG